MSDRDLPSFPPGPVERALAARHRAWLLDNFVRTPPTPPVEASWPPLPKRWHQCRVERGLTQDAVGTALQVSRTTISMIECDRWPPSRDLAAHAAVFFGVPFEYLYQASNHHE